MATSCSRRSVLPQPVIFIVDNASDAGEALPAVIAAAKGTNGCRRLSSGRSAERMAEPPTTRAPACEFLIDPLSDDEVNRLLDCLQSHGSLGVLQDLPRELQFSAVKIKHGKELLVAMWEATAGEAFGAIIEDEYWSLQSEEARSIYGFAASLYRTRAIAKSIPHRPPSTSTFPGSTRS